jgi:hypothetical protein
LGRIVNIVAPGLTPAPAVGDFIPSQRLAVDGGKHML